MMPKRFACASSSSTSMSRPSAEARNSTNSCTGRQLQTSARRHAHGRSLCPACRGRNPHGPGGGSVAADAGMRAVACLGMERCQLLCAQLARLLQPPQDELKQRRASTRKPVAQAACCRFGQKRSSGCIRRMRVAADGWRAAHVNVHGVVQAVAQHEVVCHRYALRFHGVAQAIVEARHLICTARARSRAAARRPLARARKARSECGTAGQGRAGWTRQR